MRFRFCVWAGNEGDGDGAATDWGLSLRCFEYFVLNGNLIASNWVVREWSHNTEMRE